MITLRESVNVENCIDICCSFENATSELNSTSEVYKLKNSHKPKCFGEKKVLILVDLNIY